MVAARNRKLMRREERLIWGWRDGSTMQVVETEIEADRMAICWENYMPLYRQHLDEEACSWVRADGGSKRDRGRRVCGTSLIRAMFCLGLQGCCKPGTA